MASPSDSEYFTPSPNNHTPQFSKNTSRNLFAPVVFPIIKTRFYVEANGEIIEMTDEEYPADAIGNKFIADSRRSQCSQSSSLPTDAPRALPSDAGGRKTDLTTRRAPKKWTSLESNLLRKEVETHGIGQWVAILERNKDTFIGRTNVDLKDKWRNMMKTKSRQPPAHL